MTTKREPRYTFDLVCPRCKREDMIESDQQGPPALKCGSCFARYGEAVEVKIVRVLVGAFA